MSYGADAATSNRRAAKGKRIMEAQRTRRSMGRWYILFLISLMYLITPINVTSTHAMLDQVIGAH